MTARLVLMFSILILAGVASADDIKWRWKSSVGGYVGHVQTAPSDPDTEDTASVAIQNDATGSLLLCLPAGPGELLEVVMPTAVAPRVLVRAFAFSEPGCIGLQSDPSVDRGKLPAKPNKVVVQP